MHAAAINLRGGVSPRSTLLRGQSIIEYVLIIAIIGLVVIFAGPWIASAIRNQFNAVTETLDGGTVGENFYEPEDIPDPENGTAFAVYSEDDHSLMFYKRRGVPKVGDMFNYRRVTEVYTGFENNHFSIQTSDDGMARDWTCNALPWWNRRDSVKTATVVDRGITPTSICGWFMRMSNLTAADLSNLDCGNTYTAWCAFLRCTSLTSLKSPKNFHPTDLRDFVYYCNKLKDLDTSSWNMGRCMDIAFAFAGCYSLETLDGAEAWDTSSLNCTNGAFAYCSLLKLDCSDWNVSNVNFRGSFNDNAPGVTEPKWAK